MGASGSTIKVSQGSKRAQYEMATREWLLHFRNSDIKTTVEHYIPVCMPLTPIVLPNDILVIKSSWAKLQSGEAEGLRGKGASGLVVLFDSFYTKLFSRSKVFQAHFGSNIKVRGEILIRIIQFVTTLDLDDLKVVKTKLYFLGRAHVSRNIRPWQYGMFVETLIETIMITLGDDGDYECARAWVQVMAYIMRNMLPEAIRHSIKPEEHTANYSISTVRAAPIQLQQFQQAQKPGAKHATFKDTKKSVGPSSFIERDASPSNAGSSPPGQAPLSPGQQRIYSSFKKNRPSDVDLLHA